MAKAKKLTGTKFSQEDVEAEIYLAEHEVTSDDARKIGSVTVGSDSDPLSLWGGKCYKNVSPVADFFIPDIKQEPCSENVRDDAESDRNLADVAVKMEVESHDDTEPPSETQTRPGNKQCRICLDQCDKLTLRPLFPVRALFDQLQAIMRPYFHQCFGRETDKYFDVTKTPDKICSGCLRDLRIAAVFIKKAIRTEVVLRNELNNRAQQKIPAGAKPGPVIGGRTENGVTGSNQQLGPGVSSGNTVRAPALRCYTRKSSARKGLVKRETSSSCLDEGSPGLQHLLTEDQGKCASLDEVKPPVFKNVDILHCIGEGSIALPDLLTKDQIKSESEPSLPIDHNQTQETDQPTINVDSTSNAVKNDDDAIVKYIPNSVREKRVGQLCENCGEILTVSRFQHYKKSVQCNKARPKCKECGRGFRDQNDLIRHMVVHTGELSFHCNLCPMKYKHETNLKRHVALHAEGNAHVCEACGKSFSTRHYMLVHRRVHVDPSLAINCSYCSEKLENQQQLDHHIEDKHMDEYIEDQFAKGQPLPAVLQCHFCVRKFLDPKRRKKHEVVHSYSKRRARARNANKTYVELNEQKKKKGKGTTKRRISRRRKQDDEVSLECDG